MFGRKRRIPFDEAFEPYNNVMPGDQPRAEIPPLQSTRRPGFWQGGNKFGWRDGLAGVLAAVGDAFAQQSGGRPMAVQNLTGGRLDALELAREAQQKQAETLGRFQRAQAMGADPGRADMFAHGDLSGKDLLPQEPDLPERVRTSQWYMNATPEERVAFDTSNPIITAGTGSTVVPRSSFASQLGGLPGGLDPNRYEIIEGPQNSAPLTPNGESEEQMMQRLYREQFGQRGDAMFAEWRRNRYRKGS